MYRIFITGTAGFIGFHLARMLLEEGHRVYGFDGMTSYYDVRLKHTRHAMLREYPTFQATEAMLEDLSALQMAAQAAKPDIIVHLAAQAGVRYSLENPRAYVDANLLGTFHLLQVAQMLQPRHLLMASTSSVYGANPQMPFAEAQPTDWPLTLYAATKKANESMAHAYAHIHSLPITMFRFFTVYGPWGRPDMALFKFTRGILEDQPIDIYNHGQMQRDFTYVDDLVRAIRLLIEVPPPPADARQAPHIEGDTLSLSAPWRVVNIGNSTPVSLLDFVEAIESEIGRPARRNYLPMQTGDVPATWADCSLLQHLTGFRPDTPVCKGVAAFVRWYREYYCSDKP
jgi:UDP-glucuronate 4-epimerase